MKTYKIEQQNFKASYLCKARINKCTGTAKKPLNVNILELDKYLPDDVKSINEIIRLWGDKTYIKFMIQNSAPEERILALTTQNENLDVAEPEKILGVLQYYNDYDDYTVISRLQVKPDTKYNNNHAREYTHVGQELIKALVPLCGGKDISLFAAVGAVKFYEKLGFEHDIDNYHTMRLKNKKGYLL